MDEMTLGWAKLMRKAYPRLSVTMEARASGAGVPALTAGIAHAAPVGREVLPAEEEGFVNKFGYKPTAFRVATGSVGSLGKTAASIIMVDKANPISCLSLQQLDSIYSQTRNRGGQDITNWGQVGLTGAWGNKPIHLYGLKHPNGIEWYFQIRVMKDGKYRDGIQFTKGKGFTHAFNVAADDMATHPGGLTYALLANIQANTKVVALSENPGGRCVLPTTQVGVRSQLSAEPLCLCLRQQEAGREARAEDQGIPARGAEPRRAAGGCRRRRLPAAPAASGAGGTDQARHHVKGGSAGIRGAALRHPAPFFVPAMNTRKKAAPGMRRAQKKGASLTRRPSAGWASLKNLEVNACR